jgi:hypothetical protein
MTLEANIPDGFDVEALLQDARIDAELKTLVLPLLRELLRRRHANGASLRANDALVETAREICACVLDAAQADAFGLAGCACCGPEGANRWICSSV